MLPTEAITAGLELVLVPQTIFYLLLGVVAGFVVGVLPGFNGANAAALVLPFSLTLRPEAALILMGAIYAGSVFAGSVPAILLNVPGTTSAAATALEGYPLAKQGRANYALGIARMSSALGGLLAVVIILIVLNFLAEAALKFGTRELFVVTLFGLGVIAAVVGQSFRKGLVSACLGLLIAAMSASPLTGSPRFALGYIELYENIPLVPAVTGLFAVTQMLLLVRRDQIVDVPRHRDTARDDSSLRVRLVEVTEGIGDTVKRPLVIIRSTLIGLMVGIIPGAGTTVGTFLSYGVAKRRSKNRANFGSGEPEGIIAAEAADNATAAATLVPTFTLGIPGSAVAAVMMGAMLLHGVVPGPRVVVEFTAEVYAVLIGLGLAAVLIIPLGLLLATPLTYIVKAPPNVLVPVVMVLALVGSFAGRRIVFDVGLAIAFGLLGFVLRIHGYPLLPMLLALILGPLAERNLMRALTLGGNRASYFFASPIALTMWLILLAIIVFEVQRVYRRRSVMKRKKRGPTEGLSGVHQKRSIDREE